MLKLARLAFLFLFAGTVAFAAEEKKAPPADAKPTFHASKTSTVTSKVKAVDQKTRKVTLVSENGEEVTFTADQRIKNLPQLKVGDLVTATVTESLSARVLKPGESVPVSSGGTTLATAPLGAKPAGYTAKEVYVVVTVAAIDIPNMVLTLKSASGETFPVKAQEKKNLEKLKVGDSIEIHATKSLAVEVTTPQPKS